jgi:hypothetical protein
MSAPSKLLMKHSVRGTSPSNHRCKICGFKCKETSVLKEHTKKIHEENPVGASSSKGNIAGYELKRLRGNE